MSPFRLRLAAVLIPMALLFVAPRMQAQSLVAPGPLSTAHAEYDKATGCLKCHELLGKVSRERCLGCHQHQDLARAISDGHGLHAGFTHNCTECHTEHKGRKHDVVDWRHVGGRANFKHEKTGFSLKGQHKKAKCIDCHKGTTRSGNISFPGLSQDCDACHHNPHAFSKPELRQQCTKCHVPGVAAETLKPNQIPFDHTRETGVALVGKHAQQSCVKCHAQGKMQRPEHVRSCSDCHENTHGTTFTSHACKECHDPARTFRKARFKHNSTGFPLEGPHARVKCARCHKDTNRKPERTCSACHKDPHKERFGSRSCEQCHASAKTSKLVFNHTKQTTFALTGTHAKQTCRRCHAGKGPLNFARNASADCQSCHTHRRAHAGQFADRACLDCHQMEDLHAGKFDHNRDARFALSGKHAAMNRPKSCKKCHRKGLYRTQKVRCVDCHKDVHTGQLGDDCARCHDVNTKFANIAFDHNAKSNFQLKGNHQHVACAKCHPQGSYKHGQTNCIDCHAKSDPHVGKLGTKCESCHEPVAGASKFEHNSMTPFALTGAHSKVACTNCHRQAFAKGPPRLGWTRTHKQLPVLDKSFPVMGTTCSECHADGHERQLGKDCARCHNTLAFDNIREAVHDTGAFRLEGTHSTLPCGRCHREHRELKGLGEQCQLCHQKDDAHNNALGPYCGECHNQVKWRPARFSHFETVFPLRGAHRSVECQACHGHGIYQGLPTDCEICHQRDAARVRDPLHSVELQPCDRCHNEISFIPVHASHDSYPLLGRHLTLRCRNCHPTGTYAGTPSNCENCHLALYYDASTVPDHVAENYSTSCEDCHTPMGWRPALRP